jgi:hypothetical protein
MLARQVLGTVHNDQEDRHHAPQCRRSHAWFTESAPKNIWPTNPLEKVLFMAWNSMTINTLPLALLNSQV